MPPRIGTIRSTGLTGSGLGRKNRPTQFGIIGANLKVLGVPQAIRRLQLVGSVVGREVGYLTYASTQRVYSSARERVHVKSGKLRKGIQMHKAGKYDWIVTASSRAGGANREYAAYEEYGWSGLPGGHPYLRPAALEGESMLRAGVRSIAMKVSRI